MPTQSRAQRRRAAGRQQGRPANAPRQPQSYTNETIALTDVPVGEPIADEQPLPTTAASTSRAVRRIRSRTAPEPVDYTRDYRDAARDLRLIALWSVLLFVAMFALAFSGIV
jgi:hypothetical protein